jgi:hypothetical protein
MKMSTSLSNLHESSKMEISNKKNEQKSSIKKRISLQDDYFKEKIYYKLNEGCVLNYIRNSKKKETVKTNCSESTEKNYDLSMLNKYDEDLNSSLSFISEFDLENEENDNSFNSSFDDNSVEVIEITSKIKSEKKII